MAKPVYGFAVNSEEFLNILRIEDLNPTFTLPTDGAEYSYYIQPRLGNFSVSFNIDTCGFAKWALANESSYTKITDLVFFDWVDGSPQLSIVSISHGFVGESPRIGKVYYDSERGVCYVRGGSGR